MASVRLGADRSTGGVARTASRMAHDATPHPSSTAQYCSQARAREVAATSFPKPVLIQSNLVWGLIKPHLLCILTIEPNHPYLGRVTFAAYTVFRLYSES